MNKQEAIECIKNFSEYPATYPCAIVRTPSVIEVIKEMDEPKKVKVSEAVARWYEENKDDLEYGIWQYIRRWNEHKKDEFWKFMNHGPSKPFETLIRMKSGYEVEEPKYYVELPFENWDEDAAELKTELIYLGFNITSDETTLMANKNGWGNFKTRLDEETIKSIDERYWPFAVPVEKV